METKIVKEEVPKVLLPVNYALGWRTDLIDTSFNYNKALYWNKFESNSNTIKKTTDLKEFCKIQLAKGYTYKLTGAASILVPKDSKPQRRFSWYNLNESKVIGTEGGFEAGSDNQTMGVGAAGPAIAYIYTEEDTIVELSCTYSTVDSEYQTFGSYFNIENLQNLSID